MEDVCPKQLIGIEIVCNAPASGLISVYFKRDNGMEANLLLSPYYIRERQMNGLSSDRRGHDLPKGSSENRLRT